MPEPETSIPPNVCWPVGGEIDIMESYGCAINGDIQGTLHYGTDCGEDLNNGVTANYPNASSPSINFSEDFHVFTVEWDSEQISWYVDGNFYEQRSQSEQPEPHIPQTPFYVILNTGISSWTPPPAPQSPTVYHIIDYVRAYQPAP